MTDVYAILHYYTVDGGFGDAIQKKDVIGFVTSEEEAKEYCRKYDSTHVYDKPYAELTCGELGYVQLNQLTTAQSPWSRRQRRSFDNRYYLANKSQDERGTLWKL